MTFTAAEGPVFKASQVSGAGAAIAALKEVESVPDLEAADGCVSFLWCHRPWQEEIQLDFHPLRIQNISIGQASRE